MALLARGQAAKTDDQTVTVWEFLHGDRWTMPSEGGLPGLDVTVPLRKPPKYEVMLPQIVEMTEAGSGVDLISRALGLGAEVVRDALHPARRHAHLPIQRAAFPPPRKHIRARKLRAQSSPAADSPRAPVAQLAGPHRRATGSGWFTSRGVRTSPRRSPRGDAVPSTATTWRQKPAASSHQAHPKPELPSWCQVDRA